MIEHFTLSTIGGIGMATLIVEKGDDFPIKKIKTIAQGLVRFLLGESWSKVFECTVCMSFWTALICELILYFTISKSFTWPISGFAAAGISFYLIDFLNTLDTRKG
jgi:hypothetical protein